MSSPLKNPWVGGFNFTEWSVLDIDIDGIKDLVVFDKSGEIIRTFKNDNLPGIASFKHAPEYQSSFPTEISSWVLFYDFNNDGKEDLFTYALGLGVSGYTKTFLHLEISNFHSSKIIYQQTISTAFLKQIFQ